jgi:hypothetical protein
VWDAITLGELDRDAADPGPGRDDGGQRALFDGMPDG